MNNEIIVVKQLPVIVEQLQTIKADVTARTEEAMKLVCTEDTVKAVKNIRAELKKEFIDWEERRKEVKKAIISPYEQFEIVYKDCITNVFKAADSDLKGKIDSVESEIKWKKASEVQTYFDEYLASKNIPIAMNISDCKLNITLSASLKSLKEQVKATIDRVCDDLALIDTQEHKDEILFEYKRDLNVSAAITTVANRYKAIEEAKAKEAERQAKAEAEQKAAEKVETVIETLTPPTVEEKEPIKTVVFKVTGTLTKLRELKAYLEREGFDYE